MTVGAAVVAVTLAGLGSVPARSADTSECPEAATTVARGAPVTGKTVSSGTTPEAFTGEVIGVLADGLAPDLDLVVVRLTSPEIDRVGGIWAGMSGSPVYTEDGELVGAVAYGFSFGPSPVAGVTPAAAMQELLTLAPTDPAAARTLRTADRRTRVTVPEGMRARMVGAGVATRAEVEGGLVRLPLPLGISGLADGRRVNQVMKRLKLDNVRPFKAGAVTPAAETYPIVAGGNLAASLSYGDVTAAALGTATAVCGDQVLAFGHPMIYSGQSTLGLHGADALYVQEDPAYTAFKQGNIGAPMGAISQDRLAGLLGGFGAAPPATDITSIVTVGTRSRTGTTLINVPAFVPDLAFSHLLVDQDRVFDAWARGTATAAWTVRGKRADGTPFAYTRADRFASTFDITFDSAWELAEQLYRLQSNQSEELGFTEIDTRSTLSPRFSKYSLGKVQIRAAGRWRPLPDVVRLRAGTVKAFRLTLTSAQLPTRTVRLAVPVPRGAAGRSGFLQFLGGNSYFPEGDWYEPTAGVTVDDILREIRTAPRNDDTVADLRLFRRNGGEVKRLVKNRVGAVVDGFVGVEVRVRRR